MTKSESVILGSVILDEDYAFAIPDDDFLLVTPGEDILLVIPGEDNLLVIPSEDNLLVIPGEDPGSTVYRCHLQTPAARNGSRIKSGMTV